MANPKREKIEKLVLDVVRTIDNDKMMNYDYYKMLFKKMTDAEFAEWAGSMGHDLDDTIQIYQLPFEEVKLSQIKKAASILNLPLEEYIWYYDKDPEGIRTKTKCPVGYIPIKRVQQMLNKKNKLTTSVDERSLKTGQAKGHSKVAAIVDTEAYALSAINANLSLKELLGARADNEGEKMAMMKSIMDDGYCSLEEMAEHDDITKHTTLNTLDVYLIGSGFKTNLINSSLKTAYTTKMDLQNKKR